MSNETWQLISQILAFASFWMCGYVWGKDSK